MKKILISVIGIAVFLTACGGPVSERDRFVTASVEFGCMIFADYDAMADSSVAEEKLIEVFSDYGFDINDEAAMNELDTKYGEDEEVYKEIQEGIAGCAGEAFAGMMMQQ